MPGPPFLSLLTVCITVFLLLRASSRLRSPQSIIESPSSRLMPLVVVGVPVFSSASSSFEIAPLSPFLAPRNRQRLLTVRGLFLGFRNGNLGHVDNSSAMVIWSTLTTPPHLEIFSTLSK